jgi:hypothetical protein
MKLLILFALLAVAGCRAAPPKPVVILGNKTTPAVCECPDAAAERARADRWKAYAEKLETELGMPHANEDKP